MTSQAASAIGCAVHSGWAAVIALIDAGGGPRILVRERVVLADPRDPEAKQPYHAVEELPVSEAQSRISEYEADAEGRAHRAVETIAARLTKDGHPPIGLGILDSSGRQGDSLASILASHALIHTAEGEHFRKALAAAAARCRLPAFRVRARELDARAAEAIGKPAESLQQMLKEIGREIGPPWTTDQKAATLLAWMALRASLRASFTASAASQSAASSRSNPNAAARKRRAR